MIEGQEPVIRAVPMRPDVVARDAKKPDNHRMSRWVALVERGMQRVARIAILAGQLHQGRAALTDLKENPVMAPASLGLFCLAVHVTSCR